MGWMQMVVLHDILKFHNNLGTCFKDCLSCLNILSRNPWLLDAVQSKAKVYIKYAVFLGLNIKLCFKTCIDYLLFFIMHN